MAFTQGEWWMSNDGKKKVSDSVTSERAGKLLRTLRFKKAYTRTWRLTTYSQDTRVQNPGHVTNVKCWNVPNGSIPDDPSSETDWLLTGAEYTYDMATGEVNVVAAAAQSSGDWETIVTMDAFGGL